MRPTTMTAQRAPLDPALAALLDQRREWYGMPRDFYQTDALYAAEIDRKSVV